MGNGLIGSMIRCLIIFLTLSFYLIAKEPIRTWTSTAGRTLEARYLEMVGTKVRIENASGRTFTVPLTGFSPADQEYVKQAHGRSLFAEPQPFEDDGRGGVIVASAKGRVEVLVPPRDSYSEVKPEARAVIVGESIGPGATLITGSGAEADLLLTNGILAHLGENTKLILSALYQKGFKGTDQKASELTKEVSPSRTALKLEEGDLVLEVRKLGKESSFLVATKIAQAGIRGTQFKVSASADSAELSVLEGRVDFLDSEEMATAVTAGKKIIGLKEKPSNMQSLSNEEQAVIKKSLEQVKLAVADIDINQLAYFIQGPKGRKYTVKSIDMELIWCPPGKFIMGPGPESVDNSPAHPVVLTQGFYLGKYEVTQEQFEGVMGNNPSEFRGDKLPVEKVSWDDAIAFCEALTKKEGKRGWEFSLPTEAQWEYACRAGTSTNYSWGDSVTPELANYNETRLKKTLEVGSYRPNPWGFYDMHGNVAEWCQDIYGSYTNKLAINPFGPDEGEKRVRRGGSWNIDQGWMRSAMRYGNPPNQSFNFNGFRVALKQVD